MMSCKTTCIVIDDDRDTVDLFSEYLELNGVNVLGKGCDGLQAVELYQKLKPEIVFLDVMMPVFDGFYGIQEIRKINPDAVIIAVTADLTTDTACRLVECEVNAIIYKPFELYEIIKTVEKFCQSGIRQGQQITT